jgi:hypothetical protein
MSAIFYLLTNIFMTGTSIIGCATIINKIGKFCKVIDENKKDGFKLAFDTIMLESINDMNNCVESISSISNNASKIVFILYDITIGKKFIKKDKDGKIIICNKTKILSGFKDKINELNTKVKKYQEELSKIRKPKNNFINKKKNKSDNDSDDSNYSDDSDDELSNSSSNTSSNSSNNSLKKDTTYSDISSDESASYKKNTKKDDDFYLES